MCYNRFTCCADNKTDFAIVIYNANGVTDDNFEVFLNGISIGTINNFVPFVFGKYTGRIFTPGPTLITRSNIFLQRYIDPITPAGPTDNATPTDQETPVTFSKSLLITGSNNLRIEKVFSNGLNNWGIVLTGHWTLNPSDSLYHLTSPGLTDQYSGSSFDPTPFEFTFGYP